MTTMSDNANQVDLEDPASYPPAQQLDESCDLVMKGGITSGVVYPLAVCQLATGRKICSVGGTSAGAIAAGGAAVAEVGRASGGFARLAMLPDWLSDRPSGKHTNLFHLFQAQPQTRSLYRLVAAVIGRRGKIATAVNVVVAAVLLIRPLPALLLVGVPLLILIGAGVQGGWVGLVGAVLLALVGLVLAVAWSVLIRLRKDLPKNDLGLCSGMAGAGSGSHQPLTDWLADVYDSLGGIEDPKKPVTFGHLSEAGVELAMFTTNLTLSSQAKLPFASRIWAFKPEDFRKLFPGRIVEWMIANPPEPRGDDDRQVFERFREEGYAPLPPADKMPIVVAVRMSLSFPVLLSTIPLYAIDYTTPSQKIIKHRFSDGGITSNFPLQFFDNAVPRRPTFAINLVRREKLATAQCDNVSMPGNNLSGILARPAEVRTFGQFVGALKNAVQNWADKMQTHVPGYRDRIVAVQHTKSEGGLNLDMEGSVVRGLAERGRCAAERTEEFDFANHRWLRFRSFLQVVEEFVRPAAAAIRDTDVEGGGPTFEAMIDGPPPNSYRGHWSSAAGHQVTDAVVDLADAFESTLPSDGDSRFIEGAPKPSPILQIRPNSQS